MSDAPGTDEERPRERPSASIERDGGRAPRDRKRRRAIGVAGAWLLTAVPLVAVVELALHAKQTSRDVVPASDWADARERVRAELRPDDLVVFTPFWADPIGRQSFGEDVATMKREGRSDERRFARAFEVSIRGAHAEALATWTKRSEQRTGAVTVTLYENPAYTKVVDDLVDLVTPERLTVTRVDDAGEHPCTFQRGVSAGGSTIVPQGLLTPADKFVCPRGGHVGVAVLHALDHHPHLCIYATPLSGSARLRLRFSDVTFGSSLFGHSGLQWVVERKPTPDKLEVAFSSGGSRIGTIFHKVGAGWTGFELPTPELEGTTTELVAELAPSTQRQFCFEATTRRVEALP